MKLRKYTPDEESFFSGLAKDKTQPFDVLLRAAYQQGFEMGQIGYGEDEDQECIKLCTHCGGYGWGTNPGYTAENCPTCHGTGREKPHD